MRRWSLQDDNIPPHPASAPDHRRFHDWYFEKTHCTQRPRSWLVEITQQPQRLQLSVHSKHISALAASQGAPPECKYQLFTGTFRWDGLVTGIWIFAISNFVLGYAYLWRRAALTAVLFLLERGKARILA